MTHEELIQAALFWAKQGVPVFPTDANKRPLTKHGHKDASTDEAEIRRMYGEARNRATGIGAAMGEKAGLFCIDADVYKPDGVGANAQRYIDQLKQEGLLPETRLHKTTSGGLHYILFSEHAWPNCKPTAGVEVKGEGGYIIVPDTPGYTVEHEGIAYAPEKLLASLRASKAETQTLTVDALKAQILSGESFHDAINQLAAKLAAHGWAPERVQNEVLNTLSASVARMPSHPRHARWQGLVENKGGEFARMLESSHKKFHPTSVNEDFKEAFKRAGFLENFTVPAPRIEGPEQEVPPEEAIAAMEGDWPFEGGYFGHEKPDAIEQKYLVHPLLVEGETLLLSATPKAGKTLVAQTLGMHLAAGQNLGDLTVPESRPVLYFGLESQLAIKRRMVAWKSIVDPNETLLTEETFPFYVYERGMNLLDEKTRQDIANRVVAADRYMQAKGRKPLGAVIFDTLTKAMPGGDQNSVEDTSAVFDIITRIRDLGCKAAIIFIHHDNRAGTGARGSSNIQAEPDTLLGIDRDTDTDELVLKIRMARNIEDDFDWRFTRLDVKLGVNSQGFEVKAPVLAPSEMASEKGDQSAYVAQTSAITPSKARRSKAQEVVRAVREVDIFRVIKNMGIGQHVFRSVHLQLKNKLTAETYPVFHKRADSPDVTRFFEELIPSTGRMLEGGFAFTLLTTRSPSTGNILITSIRVSKMTTAPQRAAAPTPQR